MSSRTSGTASSGSLKNCSTVLTVCWTLVRRSNRPAGYLLIAGSGSEPVGSRCFGSEKPKGAVRSDFLFTADGAVNSPAEHLDLLPLKVHIPNRDKQNFTEEMHLLVWRTPGSGTGSGSRVAIQTWQEIIHFTLQIEIWKVWSAAVLRSAVQNQLQASTSSKRLETRSSGVSQDRSELSVSF